MQFDADCKFVNNADEGELFAMAKNTRLQLKPLESTLAPKHGISDKFTMLGVVYSLVFGRRVQLNCSGRKGPLVDRIQTICDRISIATYRKDFRIQLVRSLLVMATTWAGAYNRPRLDVLTKWRYAIERCILGKMPKGKSTMLVWELLIGPECDPFLLYR